MNKDNIKKMKHSNHEIVIPQLIVGESYVQILKRSKIDDQETNLQAFFKLVGELTDLNQCSPPMNRDMLVTALRIINTDSFDEREMDYCDALITAMALNDNTDCFLFTSDQRIQQSPRVFDIIEQRRSNDDVKIRIISEM